MTPKDALGFVIDYGKFIATLWNGYVVFTVAVIGWMINLHKDGLDQPKRNLFIVAYLAATFIFGFVLWINHKYFLDLHRMLHKIADDNKEDESVAAYLHTLGKNDPGPMLNLMLGGLLVAALLAAGLMWFIPGK